MKAINSRGESKMFGAIVLVIVIIYAVRMFFVNTADDIYGRINFKNDRFNTYIDHNGILRDLNSNKYRFISTDYKGDVHLEGKGIENVNISQQEREKEYIRYKHAMEQGLDIERTTVYWSPTPDYDISREINILGKRYKDIETGKVLVVREHNYQNFYVTTDTMEVVRYTDSQRRTMKLHNNYSEEKEIKDIAAFQKYINAQRINPNYIGDPTRGIGILNLNQLEDYWKPKKISYQ